MNYKRLTSSADRVVAPRILRRNEAELKRLQRQLSQKQKNSARYDRALAAVHQLQTKIRHQRQDFLNKLSRQLCRENQAITVEGSRFVKFGLGRGGRKSAADASFGTFRTMLGYKADEEGCVFRQLDPKKRTKFKNL
jgi:putative transposase